MFTEYVIMLVNQTVRFSSKNSCQEYSDLIWTGYVQSVVTDIDEFDKT